MGKGRRRSREAPDVEPEAVQPVDVDGVRTVAILTLLWAVVFVVLAFRIDSLEAGGYGWWLWTCLAGVGLGLLGLEYTRRRRDAIEQARLDAEAAAQELDDSADEGGQAPGTGAPYPDQSEGNPRQADVTRVDAARRDVQPPPEPVPQEPAPREQTSPDALTRPIDSGTGPQPRRPGRQPGAAAHDTSGHGRPGWPSVRTDAAATGRAGPGTEPLGRLGGAEPVAPAPRAERVEPALPVEPVAPALRARPNVRPTAPPPHPGAPPTGPSTTEGPAAEPGPLPARGRRARTVGREGRMPSSELFGDVSSPPNRAPTSPVSTGPPSAEPDSPPTVETPPPAAPGQPVDDEPLLDTTIGGGRRARRDDSTEEIDEITEGGGQYRGRRARRSDSA